eukprot:6190000-Pleurochrysis_carterae.AAC.2
MTIFKYVGTSIIDTWVCTLPLRNSNSAPPDDGGALRRTEGATERPAKDCTTSAALQAKSDSELQERRQARPRRTTAEAYFRLASEAGLIRRKRQTTLQGICGLAGAQTK